MNVRLVTLLIGIVLAGSFAAYNLFSEDNLSEPAQMVNYSMPREEVELEEKEPQEAEIPQNEVSKEEDELQEEDPVTEVELILEGFDKMKEEYTSLDGLNPFAEQVPKSSEEGN
ncbi:MAG: hypothetical protein COT88_02230 [Candidatus Colwellbacteria bacterium CG10_big_fil_rev_8_21_14_0_10_41_28]|uniref:Uncharacterized protein n=1 Tax=Candidatus Colwellbacteria bacterium CG10_big_fil_rev_8_21_14_0_10_41_28 TaxID=1974539 RepID=A0A2H0VIY0_9BACT|nr:MAG: hypothetical protein COT88_02230 [Candidatus Colwellbacteria bacterium CG10_big_fil_rev_8_21_14_0_10_41_28]